MGLTLASRRVHVGDVAEALLILEPLAASLCAEQANRERNVLPALYKNLEETEEAKESGALFTQKSRQFHDILTDSIGNQTLRLVLRSLASLWSAQEETWIEGFIKTNAYFDMNAREEVLAAHRAIVSDIERGDAERASRHARNHLKIAQSLLLDKFTDQVVDVTSIRARNASGPVSTEGGHVVGVGL
jgi:DNA-binding FadR family transcriptional regulator